jgi:hypothetical protein
MTTPAEEETEVPLAPSPVLVGGTVHLGHAVDSQQQAADFGSYITYTTPAGPDQARQVLPFDNNRHRGVLTVAYVTTPAPGSAYPTPGIWIGTQAQCQASPPAGGFLPVGTDAYVIEHNQAVWMIGDGASNLRVTVAMERWA